MRARPAIVPGRLRVGANHILYDETAIPAPGPEFFDPAHWRRVGAVRGVAEGRGAACIFGWRGADYVLRHYRRGGWMARLSDDRYAWTGLERTRAWREWQLLAWMYARGLPVPRPVAARVFRNGPFYAADLVTLRLPRVWPLAELLMRWPLPDASWQEVGAAVARLHAAGVRHADLNARNILLDDAGAVFLIDFDKAERRSRGDAWQKANLARLRRSLDKFNAAEPAFHFDEHAWDLLLSGYRADQAGGEA